MVKKIKEIKEQSKKAKHPGGRPSIYSFELAQEMCEVLGITDKSIEALCNEHDHWPCDDTFFIWLNKYKEFSDLYYVARRNQVERLVEKMAKICSNRDREYVTLDDGRVVANMVGAAKDKLEVDNLKWRIARLRADIYGDRPIVDNSINEEEAIKRIRDLIHKCSQPK